MRWFKWKWWRFAFADGYRNHNICVTDYQGEWKRFGFGLFILIRRA
tara:strand:- start:2146 stop:2283 length:138 start_codon:yes stop_codon:yes gene_type:complete